MRRWPGLAGRRARSGACVFVLRVRVGRAGRFSCHRAVSRHGAARHTVRPGHGRHAVGCEFHRDRHHRVDRAVWRACLDMDRPPDLFTHAWLWMVDRRGRSHHLFPEDAGCPQPGGRQRLAHRELGAQTDGRDGRANLPLLRLGQCATDLHRRGVQLCAVDERPDPIRFAGVRAPDAGYRRERRGAGIRNHRTTRPLRDSVVVRTGPSPRALARRGSCSGRDRPFTAATFRPQFLDRCWCGIDRTGLRVLGFGDDRCPDRKTAHEPGHLGAVRNHPGRPADKCRDLGRCLEQLGVVRGRVAGRRGRGGGRLRARGRVLFRA